MMIHRLNRLKALRQSSMSISLSGCPILRRFSPAPGVSSYQNPAGGHGKDAVPPGTSRSL
jgi:hypothetical protein